jgi:superfamily II DNA or RNA helicase
VKVIYGKSALKFKLDRIPTLMAEQIADGDYMFKSSRALLISDPGYGKTFTALHALARVLETGDQVRTIIFLPPVASFQWAVTTASFMMHKGLGNDTQIQVVRSGIEDIDPATNILIVSYGMVANIKSKLPKKIREWQPNVVICDEYETMASLDSIRTKIILGDEKVEGIVDCAEWKWMLTGTPIPRYNDGLFPVLNALYPDVLDAAGVGTSDQFNAKFCFVKLVKFPGMYQAKEQVAGSTNNDALADLLYNGCGAIRRKLVLEVDYIERNVLTDFKPSQELQGLTNELLLAGEMLAMDENGSVTEPSPNMTKAQRLIGTEKAKAVAEYLVQQIKAKRAAGDKRGIVCLFWHTDAGTAIFSALLRAGFEADLVDGKSDAKRKHDMATKMNEGRSDVLVGQIQSMGAAINIQHNCNHVVFAERDWSHSRQLQALQRVFRRGQNSNVIVDYCQSTNPLEEPKVRVVARKQSGAAKVLDR